MKNLFFFLTLMVAPGLEAQDCREQMRVWADQVNTECGTLYYRCSDSGEGTVVRANTPGTCNGRTMQIKVVYEQDCGSESMMSCGGNYDVWNGIAYNCGCNTLQGTSFALPCDKTVTWNNAYVSQTTCGNLDNDWD